MTTLTPSSVEGDEPEEERNNRFKASDMESDTDSEDKTNKVDDTGQGLSFWPKPILKDKMALVDIKKVYKSKLL